MVEVYDPNEQGEIVKKWLKENGSAIVMGLVIAFGGLFGFKQWQAWQVNNRQQAFAEFEVMTELLSAGQLDAAMSNYQNLREEHSGSPYASMAALQMAQARLDASQTDLAISLYRFVIDKGYPKAMTVIARERLARVLLDQGRAQQALETLQEADEITGFESRYAEVRGDIHRFEGRHEEAIAAYLEALETLEAGVGDREALVLKIEALGGTVPVDESLS
ncbi:MAG: tetratricopeptide repeat protein [Xanthomonadales bacterium]|nr:tetratricopeptide repeat protein [Xanthomonadales bacterium]